MQVIGFLIAAFLLLWMIFGGSSEQEASPDQGQPDEPRRRQNGNYPPNPNYPPWGSPPDWQDWEYDYYRRPRAYGFRSVMAAYVNGIATFIAVAVLIFLIYKYAGNTPTIVDNERDTPATEKGHDATTQAKASGKKQVKAPPIKHSCLRSSRTLDYVTAQEVKAVCPEIEFLLTKDKGYYAFLSKEQNEGQVLNEFSKNWRKKYQDRFGFDFTYYPANKLCSSNHESNIVHGDSPFIWICMACMK